MSLDFVHLGGGPPKKTKTIKSAYDSESWDNDWAFHVDGLVGSATISPSGRDVALASPEGLAIIDLDSPWSPPRRLSSHGLPWLVVDVQWSPFAARDYWVASTANHRCLVWNLNMRDDSPTGAIEHSLQAHTRAITDINFSAHHPDSLATCSVDGYVYCWDLRRPRQPALAFCDWFAGATQVKYSRQDPNILASAHDRWLHIWDIRKAAEPVKSICAHTSKIYGIDWNRTKPTCLVTCSLDKSIKFWDHSQEGDSPQRVIRTDFPMWRARHTPFAYGLLAMPQTEPGYLYLYDQRLKPDDPVDGPVKPVAVFPGHGEHHKAKEFLWRSRGGVSNDGIDNREFQLVSWGEDNKLRLHKVDEKLLETVGHVRGGPVMQNLVLTRKGAIYKTFRTVEDTAHRDHRSPTMSDSRAPQSALSLGLSRMGHSWGRTTMKAKSNMVRHLDRSQLQIDWLKRITMSKPKTASADPDGEDIFGPEWADTETIQDELLRISSSLPNVKLDNIDMESLTVHASLKGPWGVNRETIFIKVRIDIPTSYPKSKAPRFYVDKSSFMPDETHAKLEAELHELANRFLQRQQNCLYMAFTYLLGEVDLESSTAYFKNVRDFDDSDGLADDSSSEEDESNIPAGDSVMSQELSASTELDADATLATAQRQAVAPLPRFCGARWSNDGRLVCFFPTKEEKARALFGALPDSSRDKKGEPTFAGFGRLDHDSPPPKHRLHDDASGTEDNLDDSDDGASTSSSTDSEPTTVHKIGLWYQPYRHFRRTWSANDSVRSSGGGTGPGTGTGTGTSRRRPGRPKNVISIYNLQSELPSKKAFAQEYAIFGDGADVCSHNAAVAEKYGEPELAHVWRYAAMLLRRDVPLEIHERWHKGQPVLVIAKDAVARAREGDLPMEVEEEDVSGAPSTGPSLAGRVRWGYHPLARDMIDDLFEYYEKIADIQMLAMLACIFGDYSIEEEAAIAASHLPQPKTPLPMKAPSFSLEYFPTDPTLWNLSNWKSQASSGVTTPRTANTPAVYSASPSEEELHGSVEPRSNSYSCGETPPKVVRDHLRDVTSQTQSLSTSPSNRLLQRANSTVAAAFAASLPRALAGIVSASPPDPLKKRLSPSETAPGTLTPNALPTWAGSSGSNAGGGPDTPGTSRTSLSDDEYTRDDLFAMVPVAINCFSENQGLFDDDGWMSTPLIDRNRSQVYSNYRYAYAEMLQMWGQPLSRLEIMKFDVLKEDKHHLSSWFHSAAAGGGVGGAGEEGGGPSGPANTPTPFYGAVPGSPTSPFADRKHAHLQDLLNSGRAVDVTGFCRIHPNTPLEPAEYLRPKTPAGPSPSSLDVNPPPKFVNGAVGVCHLCVHSRDQSDLIPQTELECVYCWGPIIGLYVACLACGCVSHEGCLAEWHALGGEECPVGHECLCVEQASSAEGPGVWVGVGRALGAAAAESNEEGGGGFVGKLEEYEGKTGRQGGTRRRPLSADGGAVQYQGQGQRRTGGRSNSITGHDFVIVEGSESGSTSTVTAIRNSPRKASGKGPGPGGKKGGQAAATGSSSSSSADQKPVRHHHMGVPSLTVTNPSPGSESPPGPSGTTTSRDAAPAGRSSTFIFPSAPTSPSASSPLLPPQAPPSPSPPPQPPPLPFAPISLAHSCWSSPPNHHHHHHHHQQQQQQQQQHYHHQHHNQQQHVPPSSSTSSASSSHHSPSLATSALLLAGIKPPPTGDEPVSAAQLSLGKRLKRSLEAAAAQERGHHYHGQGHNPGEGASNRPGIMRRSTSALGGSWGGKHRGSG
ncbi:uncharacterized protein CTHT_0013280 [Thermochaetoides thermophila DSM 1495]|uniref:RWD domain-containing protein n=1 Tax=Chaetomium thermophilum (strain DSM 1495 / CBS 144.50 / IMI 039719) TaxID=759272 RepID=G0S1E2_CHATD|nr:hypothetical protein CTHT_0013280 [Thermochaetoides thermophila DSM 1495]EGS22852.1 hypothetical protein CTHT_0013280 [Thermochaetoides thermophila DSM 1495]